MKIVLYFSSGSNCAQRVKWALDYKALEYDLVDVSELDDPESFYELSPYGYVPVVTVGGQVISESMAIAEFIDALSDKKPLFPGDIVNQARIREICEFINSTIHPAQNSSILNFLVPDLKDKDRLALRSSWISHCLERLRPRLWSGSRFAAGEEFSLADIFLFVICEKLVSLGGSLSDEYTAYLRFIRDGGFR